MPVTRSCGPFQPQSKSAKHITKYITDEMSNPERFRRQIITAAAIPTRPKARMHQACQRGGLAESIAASPTIVESTLTTAQIHPAVAQLDMILRESRFFIVAILSEPPSKYQQTSSNARPHPLMSTPCCRDSFRPHPSESARLELAPSRPRKPSDWRLHREA